MELISICDGDQRLHRRRPSHLDVFVNHSHLVGLFVRPWARRGRQAGALALTLLGQPSIDTLR